MAAFLSHPIFALGLPHGSEWLWIFMLGLLYPVMWLWALVSCIRNEPPTGNTKIVWVLVILLLHFFGPLAYLLFRRPQRMREVGH